MSPYLDSVSGVATAREIASESALAGVMLYGVMHELWPQVKHLRAMGTMVWLQIVKMLLEYVQSKSGLPMALWQSSDRIET